MREAGALLAATFCLGEVVEIYLRAPCRAEVEKRVVMVDIMVVCGVEIESDKVLKFGFCVFCFKTSHRVTDILYISLSNMTLTPKTVMLNC
jgi:hypothetical protein